jgi:RNA polymerase sigma factor (TIGR02999 family)
MRVDASKPAENERGARQGPGGTDGSIDELFPEVYEELCRLASRYLRSERVDHTLQTSGLVHEAYLRIAKLDRVEWQSRAHVLGVTAQMMRRILVDHARGHRSLKRGGRAERLSLEHIPDWGGSATPDLIAVDDALESLAAVDPEPAMVVELKFFGGLTHGEIAEFLGISEATVKRRWQVARVWLFREIRSHRSD